MSHCMYILAANAGQPSFPVFPETSYAFEELLQVHDKSDSHEADQSDSTEEDQSDSSEDDSTEFTEYGLSEYTEHLRQSSYGEMGTQRSIPTPSVLNDNEWMASVLLQLREYFFMPFKALTFVSNAIQENTLRNVSRLKVHILEISTFAPLIYN